MGCWNATCGLTGLPIHEGDPVIAMFIQDEAYGRIEGSRRELTPSYPWQCFTPASLIARGTYDDYGSVDLDDAEQKKIMLAEARARNYGVDVAIPSKEEGGKVTYGFSMRRFETSYAIDDGHRQDDKPFALWMAHASVFDALIDETKIETYNRESGDFEYPTLRQVVQKRVASNLAKMQDGSGGYRHDDMWSSYSQLPGAATGYIGERFAMMPKYDAPTKTISYDPADISSEDTGMLVAAWADLYALNLIQSELRHTLWPTGGCGSQDSEYDAHKVRWAAAEKVIAAREEKQRGWDAEYGDEEDDDDGEDDGEAASASA